jgi:hypothetical protein
MSHAPISPLRRRMIEDMTVRGFGEKTQSDYLAFLGSGRRVPVDGCTADHREPARDRRSIAFCAARSRAISRCSFRENLRWSSTSRPPRRLGLRSPNRSGCAPTR